MKKLTKLTLGFLLSFVLAVSTPILGFGEHPVTVFAATVATTPKASINKVTLYIGYKTYQIKLQNLKKGAVISYKSSNQNIAKVSKSGIITPLKKGKTTVTATIKQNSKTYTSKITVTIATPNVKFTAKSGKLAVDDEFTFAAKVYGSASKIVWSVSNNNLAKIDSKTGKLTALKTGKVDVIATSGKLSGKYTVTITPQSRLTTEAKEYEITGIKHTYFTTPRFFPIIDLV